MAELCEYITFVSLSRCIMVMSKSGNASSHSLSVAKQPPSSGSHVKVVVRVRPENAQENAGAFRAVVRVMDENMLIFDPKEESSPEFFNNRRRRGRDITKRQSKDMQFVFDRVFAGTASNLDLFENTTKSIINSFLDGFNCSVFAYGATGAGKTHTMLGSEQKPGITFYTMKELYRRIDAMKEEKTCEVTVSYLEVYNEQIRDLLSPKGNYLPLREDPSKGVMVAGLTFHRPSSAVELLSMLAHGNQNRTQHPTDANAESSRSHAVFQVYIRQKPRTASVSTDVRVAKMSLIDLAGSERATVTKNRGARFREGANINRSLLALGNCINALAEGKSSGYVPYRNSKLTRLLKDSLGGNCKTVMIAAVSPSSMTFDDTYNTLKYANRAKNIKANASQMKIIFKQPNFYDFSLQFQLKQNVMSVDFHISQYPKIVEKLKEEVLELREKLKKAEDCPAQAIPETSVVDEIPSLVDTCKYRETFLEIFKERFQLKRDLNDLEVLKRDLTFKLTHRKTQVVRMAMIITDQDEVNKIKRKFEKFEKRLNAKKKHIGSRLEELNIRLEANTHRLESTQKELISPETDHKIPEVLGHYLRSHHMEGMLRDTQQHVRSLKRLCSAQEKQSQSAEKIISSLLQTVKDQHFLLKGNSLVTSDMSANFNELQDLIRCRKEVSWADHSGISVESEAVTPGSNTTLQTSPSSDKEFQELLNFPVVKTVPLTPSVSATPRRRTQRTPKTQGSSAKRVRLKLNLSELKPVPLQSFTEEAAHHVPVDDPSPKHEQNVTFTKGADDSGILPLPDSPSLKRLSSTPQTLKPGADLLNLENLPLCTPIINCATVVKEKASVDVTSLPVAANVKRVMNFADPVPAIRSPLASKENIPRKAQLFCQRKRKETDDLVISEKANDAAQHNMQALMKLGLPSTMDRHHAEKKPKSTVPNYMMSTQSVINRRQIKTGDGNSPDDQPKPKFWRAHFRAQTSSRVGRVADNRKLRRVNSMKTQSTSSLIR
ncbi:hypothetical protein CAPTEDRAFT_227783 [Capitella teleta]|uniref:Kinesin-like protein n=1 Tax=Capitella teleta TaxID=283909 RepID=R7VJ62_CAPTE|nr:hypothetical protein CAPTEDRAFT_227783 [Capitella teleta]|eukprot:ELU16371.1 hypothetical protein CAPTEDRAFT_227783 [Capitella teleta]